MKRAEIRLTTTSYAVMSLLEVLGEATPYDLKRMLEQSVENFWHVPHTTFYTEPTRLAQAGFLSENQEKTGRRRKLYALTEHGREALREWAASPESAPPQLRDEGMLKVFAGADPTVILTHRRTWHQAKLAELDGYLRALQDAPPPKAGDVGWSAEQRAGVHATLLAGTAYHRQLLAMVESFLDVSDTTAQTATGNSSADGNG